MTTVLVCGGRDFADRGLMARTLAPYRTRARMIVHGAAKGADMLADEWAQVWGIHSLSFPANWRKHGPAAGPIRNAQMLAEAKPDLVIAFPGGRGTANMVKLAREAGVEVIEIAATLSQETS